MTQSMSTAITERVAYKNTIDEMVAAGVMIGPGRDGMVSVVHFAADALKTADQFKAVQYRKAISYTLPALGGVGF